MNQLNELPSAFIFFKNSKTVQKDLYFKARYWLTSIVKDDVFFAPSSEIYIDTIADISAPCLSPVTSPSDFLHDSEPLFEGIDNYFDLLAEEEEAPKKSRKRLYHSATKNTKSKKKPKLDDGQMTLFEQLTDIGIDWCRYCGTTEGVNWRPGPWGKRTLCNKHGCDYKGYGLASRLPRLDLSAFSKESLQDRRRPIVQQFCFMCQSSEESKDDLLIPCDGGCSRAYHQHCCSLINNGGKSYCSSDCVENKQKQKIVVDLPKNDLPLMKMRHKSV